MPGLITEMYERPAAIVESQIQAMSARADSALNTANNVIYALSGIDTGVETSTPVFTGDIPDNASLIIPDLPIAPEIQDLIPFELPEFSELAGIVEEITSLIGDIRDVGDFNPSINSIVIPAPPVGVERTAPIRPELTQYELPADPVIQIPTLGDFLTITVPTLGALSLPTFEDHPEPNFEGVLPNTLLNWQEPVYDERVLGQVVTNLTRMLAGGTGMHPAVEAALFDRQRQRNDATAVKQTQEAFDTWAGRGYGMPPGMLVAQVNLIQEQNQLQANASLREIFIQSAQWEQENLRAAITSGIAVESLLIGQFENTVKRGFDMQVQRLRADIELYASQITLFNARQAARQIYVEVFKAKLQAALAPLEVFKALIDAEQAKATLNEATARAFAAQVDALRNIVLVYQAKIDGVKAKSEIEKQKVELYQADIQAFAALISSDKSKFEAYEAQVRGEAAKAQIIEAEARAWAATIEAQNSGNNLKVQAINARISASQAAVQKFIATVGAEREQVQAQLAIIQSKTQIFSADVGRYSAELQTNSETARLAVTQGENRLRNSLSYHEITLRQYDAALQRMIERGRVQVSGLSAAGQMASTLAAGAMSAMHVQASLSGSGSGNTSVSSSDSVSTSTSTNYNIERTE